jgi:predicted GTPase
MVSSNALSGLFESISDEVCDMSELKNLRNQALLAKKIAQLEVRPVDFLLTGGTGVGKSSLMNALGCEKVMKVGKGFEPETMTVEPSFKNDYLRFWDTPGFGDGKERDVEHHKKIVDTLNKTYTYNWDEYMLIDMALVVVDASSKDLGTTFQLLTETVLEHIKPERVLVVLNQADLAMKGRNWVNNQPNAELERRLNTQCESFKQRIDKAAGLNLPMPVAVSAKHGWGIDKIMSFLIEHVPAERRAVGD